MFEKVGNPRSAKAVIAQLRRQASSARILLHQVQDIKPGNGPLGEQSLFGSAWACGSEQVTIAIVGDAGSNQVLFQQISQLVMDGGTHCYEIIINEVYEIL